MKAVHWICVAAVTVLGAMSLQAGPQLQKPTTKCNRLDVGPAPDIHAARECKKFCVVYQCPNCRTDLIPVRVDLKGGESALSQYRTTEYRCPDCRYVMRACVASKAKCSKCSKCCPR